MDKIISKEILEYAWKDKIKPSIDGLETEVGNIKTDLEGKLNVPEEEGAEGQVLTKTEDGYGWADTKKEVLVGDTLPDVDSDIEIFIDETESTELEIYTKDDVDAIVETMKESDNAIVRLVEDKVVIGNETTNSEGWILIDETADPAIVEVYTKAEINAQRNTLETRDNGLENMIEKKVVVGNESTNSEAFILIDDTTEDNSELVYTKKEIDFIIAKLKADNNLV